MPTLGARLQAALAPRYADLVEIAAGGMGVVFRAHDTALDRPVAIKVLAPELATAAGAARFRREARILAHLSHPNIVPIHEVGERDGLFFYVMAFVEGETLADCLKRGPLPPERVAALGRQLLGALGHAHRAGIVHRDVKPSNVFLAHGRALLGDFGVAHWTDHDDDVRTHTGQQPGTPAYMAPEQFAGGEVTPRTDLYALAMVLYEAATGRHWPRLARPAAVDWSGVPRRLMRALCRALEPMPEDRWPDAAAFRAALARRRPANALLAAGAIAGAAVAVAVAGGSGPSLARAAEARPADLILLPFEDGDSADLGRRIARFAGMHLEWYPRWTVAPTLHSFARWDEARRAARSRAAFGGARFEARGALAGRDGRLALVVSIYADSGRRLHETIEIPGDPADPLAWGRATADSIVGRIFPAAAAEFHELSSRSTASIQAARELLAGIDAFVLDNMSEAEARCVEALRLDPSFMQAAWQLMLVRRWRRTDLGSELRRLYDDHGDELPALYRSLTAAQLEPDLRRRFAMLERIADSFPMHGVAQLIAADEAFHRGPLVGIPLERSVERFARGAERDAFLDQASTYDHTAWGYVALGLRSRAAEQLARRARRTQGHASGESEQRARLIALAFDARFRPRHAAVKRWLLELSAGPAERADVVVYVRLGLSFGVPELQRALGRLLATDGASEDERAQGWAAQGLAELMLGRWDEGLSRLDSAGALLRAPESRLQDAEWRVVPELFGLPERPRAERDRALATLRTAAEGGPLAPRAAWVLAMVALRAGDGGAYERWHRVVHDLAGADRTAARLDVLLHAHAAAGAGRPDSALALTEALFVTDSAGRIGGPFARTALYLGRGEWLARLGRHMEADRSLLWYQNSDLSGWPRGAPQAGEADAVFGVAARLRRADAALALGDRPRACRHLSDARRLWRDADAGVRALLARHASIGCDA